MSVPFLNSDDRYMWNHYMGGLKGNVPEPEYVYLSSKEEWGPASPWYLTRENFGRHRCPACGKPYVFMESAWECHQKASAYKLWRRFANRGAFGGLSTEDSVRLASAVIYRDSFTSGPFV